MSFIIVTFTGWGLVIGWKTEAGLDNIMVMTSDINESVIRKNIKSNCDITMLKYQTGEDAINKLIHSLLVHVQTMYFTMSYLFL